VIPFILKEGLYDPGIFKAFFLAGGPGSGKTYVTTRVTGGMGLKNVNSDRAFEQGLKKAGLSLKMPDVEAKQRDPIRMRAKELTGKALENYIQGRLGLVVDSTGLDVAMSRNAERDRTVPPEILKKNWNTVQRNIGKFQRLFGQQKMIIVDNNKADENIIMNVYKQVAKFVKKPIESHIAKQWMRKEAEKRKR
jgi:tRNA uridine 5-carbamoylmethylation protein Kti12